MHPWYVRPGARRWILLVLGLFWTISSALGLPERSGPPSLIVGVLGVVIGLAAVVSVVMSIKFDRDAAGRSGTPPDMSEPTSP